MQQGESAEGISPSSFDKLRTGSESSPARLLESYGEQVEGEEIASARDPSLGLGTPRNDIGVRGRGNLAGNDIMKLFSRQDTIIRYGNG